MRYRLGLPLVFLIIAACVPPAGQAPTDPSAGAPATTATPAPTASSPPTDSSQPTASPAATSSPPPGATARATPNSTPPDEDPLPPAAELRLPDGSAHAGALGSFFFGGAAADSPWLPARVLQAIEVAAGAQLTIALPEPYRFLRWSARFADAADETADVISQLASGGDGTTELTSALFAGPPPGSWVLMIRIDFADDGGDAAYYWHLIVPGT
jgi:hypothetical protein